MLMVGVSMIAMFAVISLAVDLGRLRWAAARMQTAADAAALAGAYPIPDQAFTQARTSAANTSGLNTVEVNDPVVLDTNQDIEFGLWRRPVNGNASPPFVPVGATESNGNVVDLREANACRVTNRRTTARGNAMRLYAARVLGPQTCNLSTTATSYVSVNRGNAFGFVALDWIRFNGTTYTDSYDWHFPYGGDNVHHNSQIASNGDIRLVGTTEIFGDARPGIGHFVDITNNTTITGWTAPLDYVLTYSPDPWGPGAFDNTGIAGVLNNKSEIAPKNDALVPAGVYKVKGWKQTGKNLTFSGPTTIWVDGDSTITGGNVIIAATADTKVTIYTNGDFSQGGSSSISNPGEPGALYLSMTKAGSQLSCSANLRAHLFAPTADIVIQGNNNSTADFFGWIVAKTLDIKGNTGLHYDETLERPFARQAVLVK